MFWQRRSGRGKALVVATVVLVALFIIGSVEEALGIVPGSATPSPTPPVAIVAGPTPTSTVVASIQPIVSSVPTLAPTATPVPTPAVTDTPDPTDTPVPKPKVLFSLKGSGIKTTKPFAIPDEDLSVELDYSFNCSAFGSSGNFQVWWYEPDGSIGGVLVNELAKSGKDSTEIYLDQSGRIHLEMNSECSWSVTVREDPA